MNTQPPLTTMPDGSLIDGKFRILRCIGKGGMGAVYEIQHAITKHKRALKLLYPHVVRDRDAVERFLREASVAGTIDNPHITETYDAGWLSSGEPYVVMELLDGESLDNWLAREGKLSIQDALQTVSQAAHGVYAAHKAGIVHRDLKPENIFITRTGAGEIFAKILDFGVSKFDDGLAKTRATQDGAFMGTPQYMSPEQFLDGKKVDGRGDLYSLGLILFECITGKHPYPCETLAELARKIMVEQPVKTSTLRGGVPPKLDAVVERALRKEPGERFHTAEAFALELDALIPLCLDGTRPGGKMTLPHGSRWPSDLPVPQRGEHATLHYSKPPNNSQSPNAGEGASGTTTHKSGSEASAVGEGAPRELGHATASGTVLISRGTREDRSAARWIAPLVLVTAAGVVAGWLLWRPAPDPEPPRSAAQTTVEAPKEQEASAPRTPDEPPAVTPSEPAAPSPQGATGRLEPSAPPNTSASAPKPTAPPSASASPVVPPKPKDYADVDEFKK